MTDQPTIFDVLRRYKVAIGAAVVGLAIALGAFLLWRQFYTLYVFNTTPATYGSISSLTPVLTLNMNKPVTTDGLSVSAPDGVSATYDVHGSALDINVFTNLDIKKTYTFTINHLTSTDGHVLKNKKVTFTTNDSLKVTDAENKLILDRQLANKPAFMSDPVLYALPHAEDDFSATGYFDPSSDGKGLYSVIVTLFVPDSDTDNPGAASIATAKAHAQAYLTSINGYSVGKYATVYKVQGYGG